MPVLEGLVGAASEHSPAAVQSEGATVTVTEPVSTGTTAPSVFVE